MLLQKKRRLISKTMLHYPKWRFDLPVSSESDVANNAHLFFPIFFGHHLSLKLWNRYRFTNITEIYPMNVWSPTKLENLPMQKRTGVMPLNARVLGNFWPRLLTLNEKQRRLFVFELPLSFCWFHGSMLISSFQRGNHVSNSCKSLIFDRKLMFALCVRTVNPGKPADRI